mmetsp:Transcript_83327/g.268576  ORF Transcript_83327/g.268576 Transcript_83327/m.268576 type:complete len:239 (-) Transcript_83327:2386-3102(-)
MSDSTYKTNFFGSRARLLSHAAWSSLSLASPSSLFRSDSVRRPEAAPHRRACASAPPATSPRQLPSKFTVSNVELPPSPSANAAPASSLRRQRCKLNSVSELWAAKASTSSLELAPKSLSSSSSLLSPEAPPFRNTRAKAAPALAPNLLSTKSTVCTVELLTKPSAKATPASSPSLRRAKCRSLSIGFRSKRCANFKAPSLTPSSFLTVDKTSSITWRASSKGYLRPSDNLTFTSWLY